MQHRSPALFRRFLTTVRRERAVKFALVAPPFIALLYAILQTLSLLFSATGAARTLHHAGQPPDHDRTATVRKLYRYRFNQAVCRRRTTLLNCSNIYVNVQTFSSFSSVTRPIRSAAAISAARA